MTKSIKLLLLSGITAILFITACKEDETPQTKTEMLTSKNWKKISYSVFDSLIYPEECEKDDYLKFSTNGTYQLNPGTIKCDTSEVIENGTWAFYSNETKLITDGDTFPIIEFNSGKLVIGIQGLLVVTLNSF